MIEISQITSSVIAGCALIGIFFAGRQLGYLGAGHRLSRQYEEERRRINADQELQRLKASAESLWREYELLCIQYPELAAPDESVLDISNGEFDGTRQGFTRYEYFVSLLLYAVEEIHEAYPDRADWDTTIQPELNWHSRYLSSDYFQQWVATNSPYISELVARLRSQSPS